MDIKHMLKVYKYTPTPPLLKLVAENSHSFLELQSAAFEKKTASGVIKMYKFQLLRVFFYGFV